MTNLLKAAFAAFFFISAMLLQAQDYTISEQSIDFGRHQSWDNPFQSIEIVNTGNKPMAILRVNAPRGVWYDYPRQFIYPGETAEISFAYYTENTGNFNVPVELFLSSNMEPIPILLKGQIKGFAFNALTACPAWNKPESKPMEFDHLLQVLDDESGLPIRNASVLVLKQNMGIGFWKTPSNGKVMLELPSGMFGVQIEAEGYQDLLSSLSLSQENSKHIFRLKKNISEKQVVQLQEIKPDTLISLPEKRPELSSFTRDIEEVEADEEREEIVELDPLATNEVLPIENFKPNNIVFLLDVSSSMNTPLRFPLLKQSLLELSGVMRSSDRISLITFASSSKIRAENIPGSLHDTLYQEINILRPSGSTNGVKGLLDAYALAEKYFIEDGNNVVILATDGAFKIVDKNIHAEELVKEKVDKGIKLSVLGFGNDRGALANLEEFAQRGEGQFFKIDAADNARNALIDIIKKLSRKD